MVIASLQSHGLEIKNKGFQSRRIKKPQTKKKTVKRKDAPSVTLRAGEPRRKAEDLKPRMNANEHENKIQFVQNRYAETREIEV